jgi:hypothetical protein
MRGWGFGFLVPVSCVLLLATLSFCSIPYSPGHLVSDQSESPSPDLDEAFAEQALRKAGIATDGPGLLAYIRARTMTAEQRGDLANKVRALGSADYKEREKASRELVALGRSALPYLRPAVDDADLECSRRARRCIEQIQRNPNPSWMTVVVLLVKARRPGGAVPVLLNYLPSLEDDALEETWLDALRTVGWHDERPDPALLAALGDKRPLLRAAAAHVLSRGPSDAIRRRVVPSLRDAAARVRFEAAAGLVCSGERTAVPELMTQLTDGPFSLACRAEYLLHFMAESQGVQECLDKDEAALRRRCRIAWENWWDKHAQRVDLTRLRRVEPARGLTLVCEDREGGGRVWTQAGQPCWQIQSLAGPQDAQVLPAGRVLIAEHHANRVTERDHAGKILWQHATTDNPIACRRLPNGNTLIATYEALYEVTPRHERVFQHHERRNFRDALPLPNGHVLYVTGNGMLVERNANCEHLLRTIVPEEHASGAKFRARVEALVNGRFLLTLGGANRVVEIGSAGKIRWQFAVTSPMSANRLPNGHTLIACYEDHCVIEVDRAGKEISRQVLEGRPFLVRRY